MSLSSISKAVAGALAGVLVTYLAKYQVELDSAAVEVVLMGLISGVIVYFSPKNK